MKLAKADEKGEREKFYEGACWLGHQSLTVANEAVSKGEQLKTEYMKKLADCEGNEFMKGRAAEWLLDSTLRLTQQVKDQNQRLMESSMRNIPS